MKTPITPYDVGFHTWINNPQSAFISWINLQLLKTSSANVYTAMWVKFTRWLHTSNIRLDTLNGATIAKFTVETQQTKLHAYRYMRLIETVYTHLATFPDYPGTLENPARSAIISLQKRYRNDDTAFLPGWARQRLLSFVKWGDMDNEDYGIVVSDLEPTVQDAENLPSCHQPADNFTKITSSLENQATRKYQAQANRLTGAAGEWKLQRDLAIVGTMLGGGLRVHEVIGLTVSCISADSRQITIPTHIGGTDEPSTFERIIDLELEASQALTRWLKLRNRATYGDVVFPSNKQGRQMDSSTVFRRVKLILEETYLTDLDMRSCCQTLRNSYIATLFDRKLENTGIAKVAGFAELISVARMRTSYNNSICY
jgi:site-specific recombinase XerD